VNVLKWLRTIIIVCFLLSVFPIQSKALSCVEITEPVIDHHDMAVVGTVLNIKQQDLQQLGNEPKRYVLMKVEKSWKQQADSQIIFEADYTWSYPFEKGKKYLVYLFDGDGKYSNSPCSPVEEVSTGVDYEGSLGKGFVPKNEVNIGYKMWLIQDQTLIVAVTGVVILVFFIFIWRRYKRK
jgi:hypothetical protein